MDKDRYKNIWNYDYFNRIKKLQELIFGSKKA